MKNLNCILTYNASYFLRRVIEKIVNDKDYLFELSFDRDLEAFYENNEKININLLCGNCEGCLDYGYFLEIYFNNFITKIREMRQENEGLFLKIEEKFDMIPSEEYEKIKNVFSIFRHIKKICDKIDREEFLTIQGLENEFQSLYSNLCQCYYANKISDCNDRILNIINVLNKRKSNSKEVSICLNEDTIYIDQNVIAKYMADNSFSRQMQMLKTKGCIFVGSSFLIEDAIKMDPIFFKSYCDNLIELTDNYIIQQNNNEVSIKHEELKYSISRVKLFRQFTRAYEERQIFSLKYNEIIYPEFKKNNGYYQAINRNIESFLTESTENDANLSENLEKVFAIESFPFTMDNLRSLHINTNNNGTITNIIDGLCKFLDVINYRIELMDKKKIMSSIQDNEHIKCARAADYFVTDDKNLFERAKLIYKILDINTKVLLINDFLPTMLKKKNIMQ
jgi:hypothetical protein